MKSRMNVVHASNEYLPQLRSFSTAQLDIAVHRWRKITALAIIVPIVLATVENSNATVRDITTPPRNQSQARSRVSDFIILTPLFTFDFYTWR